MSYLEYHVDMRYTQAVKNGYLAKVVDRQEGFGRRVPGKKPASNTPSNNRRPTRAVQVCGNPNPIFPRNKRVSHLDSHSQLMKSHLP